MPDPNSPAPAVTLLEALNKELDAISASINSIIDFLKLAFDENGRPKHPPLDATELPQSRSPADRV